MGTLTRNWITAAMLGLLVACGGGGGGDRASGVEPGPPPGGGNPPIPPPVVPEPGEAPYAEQEVLLATITEVSLNGSNQPVVQFQLTNEQGAAIVDLEAGNVRFVVSKLQGSPLGNLTGSWQSYVNRIETAGSVGPGTEDKLQATYEREEANFVNNGDGTYQYTFATDISNLPADILAQAETEGLDLSYEADRTHRVAMQFDGNPNTTANPVYDWVPATGATDGIFKMDIAATANCNNCHDPLAIHGGNRQEMQYCVTCHNAGSTDANSGNSVDMKVMIHKLHMGANLPSVQAGGEYAIWGFRDSKHDYSMLHYPQDIRNCVNCHAGTGTGAGRDDLVLTAQGDNWAEVASGAACGSCHDGEGAQRHISGQEEANCSSCHSQGGPAGSIAQSHVNLVTEAAKSFAAEITDVRNTMPGENPQVTFRISNPLTDEDYDIKNDPVFEPFGVRVGIAWNTTDYTNTGNGGDNASNAQSDAILASTDNGDGTYTVTMPVAIPDGSLAPGIAASGSGAATIEGHPVADVDGDGEADNIPLTNVHAFFSIDEADGNPVARRQSVELASCNSCHSSLVFHGSNRTDDIDGCVTCHNPRNTDKRVREIAMDPPTDGKDEESIDFKTMVHAIHAAGMRENALEVVGFRGFSTHRYTEEQVHYPGDLTNCTACHTDSGYTLPLADGVLGTTIDTGDDRADPGDDTVVTPVSAVCSSCHDDQVALSHMSSNGGNFATTQAAIDAGEVVEECSVCHGEGRSADVSAVHNPR
ncbi:OmcA/MtrC family decaheme c-type cytochrome [Pseudohalioglobus sediminis]|uniref:OmcA/MtrC family decaheme c-type cytochrome n=1 Tax=Pseudohalioglobus sediminis TaxID=2606449 RepID=A0A5B0WN98_9GAMM|nr:OmcA/MtrC family decaheme c-type cytochrome [Pseudohalioglobus sediminis]KAA1188462.1 OmcA/MtrC family decaheme c-type cytochrome [Pseudohalioglobus sediminis]